MVTIALIDDHTLMRQALSNMIHQHGGFSILFESSNGLECIHQLTTAVPDIAIVDIRMPVMDGFETTLHIKKHFPSIKVLGLSAFPEKPVIEQLQQLGASGFVAKSEDRDILWEAIETVAKEGSFFYSSVINDDEAPPSVHNRRHDFQEDMLTKKEIEFLEFCASELTYKEIAGKMKVKTRTVDNYRNSLFDKLNIKSRAGLVIYAIKRGISRMMD